MVCVADVNVAGRDIGSLCLSVAAEAKVRVVVHQQFFIDGPVRVVTNRATLAQSFVLEDKGSCLRLVAAGTTLILPGHRQPACRLENVTAVWIVAIDAIHVAFSDRMMLRQIEFRLHVEVALETGRGIFSGIDDETGAAAGPDMFAAGPVAGFATALARHGSAFDVQTGVWAGRKFADDIGVAIGARLVAHVVRAGNFKRGHERGRTGGA